jgi:uncharacterized protein (TIGR02147 family)
VTPSVYSFRSYRVYLQSFYKTKKAENSAYSFKKFAIDAGLKSANVMKLVMDGKKNLSTTTVIKFAKALDLSPRESEYFECLVHEEQAADDDERRYYKRRREKLRESPLGTSVHIGHRSKLFSHPLLLAVATLMVKETPESAHAKIKKRFSLSDLEIQNMIESLETKGLIARSDNEFAVNFKHGLFKEKMSDLEMKKYLRHHLRLSNRAFDDYGDKAKFYSHVMGVRSNCMSELVEDLRTFFESVTYKYSSEPADEVLELNSQAFFLTKKITSGS